MSARVRRDQWIAEGMHWFEGKKKPSEWNFAVQRQSIPDEYV